MNAEVRKESPVFVCQVWARPVAPAQAVPLAAGLENCGWEGGAFPGAGWGLSVWGQGESWAMRLGGRKSGENHVLLRCEGLSLTDGSQGRALAVYL